MDKQAVLRVLVVTNMYPTLERPGSGTFVAAQVDALRLEGCEVDVMLIPGHRSRLHYLWACWRVFRLTASKQYDVVHAHYGLSALPALCRFGCPLVVTYHGSDVLVGRLQPALSRFAARFADANVAVSRAIHNIVGGSHIPCGVDLDRYRPMHQAQARQLLGLSAVGKLVLFPFDPSRKVKRHPLAAAAVNLLKAEGMDIALLAVHGVPNDGMPLYYNAADVMMLTSNSEGSPTSVKEALACNLPLVSVSVGDVPDLVSGIPGVWLCDADPRSLAEGIRAATLAGARGACDGRQQMERFSNASVARSVTDIYSRLVRRHRSRVLSRDVLFWLLHACGLAQLLYAAQKQDEVVILAYHDPSPDVLDRHLQYLTRKYTVLRLVEVLQGWELGCPLAGRPLVVTLDDGHQGNAALLRVFKKYQIRPTIFLCSAIAGTRRGFWFQHVPQSARQALKRKTEPDRKEALAAFGFQYETEFDARETLSAEEIVKMREEVDFQAHTRYHRILPTCGDALASDEIAGCRAELFERFGVTADVLAYPNGDHSDRDVALARKAEFRAAVTVSPGFNSARTDRYRLHRICIPDDASVAELAVKVSGLWARLRRAAPPGRGSPRYLANNELSGRSGQHQ